MKGYVTSSDSSGSRSSVGLYYVTINTDLPLSQSFCICHSPQDLPISRCISSVRPLCFLAASPICSSVGRPWKHAILSGNPAHTLASQKWGDTLQRSPYKKHVYPQILLNKILLHILMFRSHRNGSFLIVFAARRSLYFYNHYA